MLWLILFSLFQDAVYVNVMGSFTRRKEGEELDEGRQNGELGFRFSHAITQC
jgi:hypothetical protein